ncbi:MAG: Asp23/Gls24 family envelope stress response protein [Opitutales bacterium]|jgi:uncharacterized alkaline shock family protein YloU
MNSPLFDHHDDHDDFAGRGPAPVMQDETKIALTVVASIVRLSSLEVEGVHAVGSDGFVDGLVEMLSKRESDRGVKVTEDDQGRYAIEIHVVLRFGVELAKVAEKIQANVRAKVGHMTGKPVAKIDVIIEGVRLDSPKSSDTDWHNEPHTD